MLEDNLTETELAYAQARAFGKDVARLYAAEKSRRKELETTTQKLQAIFDTAPNGLVVVDEALTVVEANPRFLALFQQEAASVIGQPLEKLMPVADLLDLMGSVKENNLNWGNTETEVTEPIKRTLSVNLSPLDDGQSWVLILHDLTERIRLENLKDEFVNIAAHELRTPLAGVMGFVGVLDEELKQFDDPMMNRLIDLILHSTERLRLTIDELVHFAATECHTDHNLHIANIDLAQLLQETIEIFKPQFEANSITCRLDVDYPLVVRGDRFILGEVIYQLLNNAVMFNKPEGNVIVRANSKIAAEETDEQATLIEVEDTGIGIPQTDLDRIFDKFYQVEEHLTRGIGGMGLGLTIARRGIEQHRGQLTVTSQLDQGSIFRITLPDVIQPRDVSIDNRLDVAHRQLLTYAREMAQAVAGQRRMQKQIKQVQALGVELAGILDDPLFTDEPASADCCDLLNRAKDIAQELSSLSDETSPLSDSAA
jgi:two-component system phosphate regulon sensor histidine kinase PhoR